MRFEVVEEDVELEYDQFKSYGIAYIDENSVCHIFSSLSTEQQEIKALVNNLNSLKPDKSHINDIIEDFIIYAC